MEVKRVEGVVHGAKTDVRIDDRGLGKYLFGKMRQHGNKIFQINGLNEDEETYDYVNRKSTRVALEMKRRGIKSTDVVLVCSCNNMDSVIPLLATLYLNAITVTLDPSISLRDTAHLLKIVRPKMIFVEEGSIVLVESAMVQNDLKAEIVVMGNHDKYSLYETFLERRADEDDFVPDDVVDVRKTAAIFFSSGTTGLPKAIELSNYSFLHSLSDLVKNLPYADIIPFASLYWVSSMVLTFMAITNGGKRIVVKSFNPELALRCIEQYKINSMFLAPSLSYLITEELIKKYPCPSLKNITFGGSTMNTEQIKKMRRYFPNSDVSLLYAQTEAGGLISCFLPNNYDEKFKEKLTSSGQPCDNIKIKIVDIDNGRVLGPNEKGEIRVSTPSVCNGYYNQDSSSICDEEGYIKTGDVGYFDEDNCLYVCDRIKEMFKYQSWHIVPLSLENVIGQHPEVSEALVIGIPNEADGHVPMALVVLKRGFGDVTEEDLLKFANERLPERERLRAGLKVVKRLPKGTTGKVLRKHVTELVVRGELDALKE